MWQKGKLPSHSGFPKDFPEGIQRQQQTFVVFQINKKVIWKSVLWIIYLLFLPCDYVKNPEGRCKNRSRAFFSVLLHICDTHPQFTIIPSRGNTVAMSFATVTFWGRSTEEPVPMSLKPHRADTTSRSLSNSTDRKLWKQNVLPFVLSLSWNRHKDIIFSAFHILSFFMWISWHACGCRWVIWGCVFPQCDAVPGTERSGLQEAWSKQAVPYWLPWYTVTRLS